MTTREDRNWRLNWMFDKLLMGVLGVLMTWMANNVKQAVDTVADLDKRMAVVEWRLQMIEKQTRPE